MHRRESEEFELRAGSVPPLALLRAATINGAKLIRRERELGSVTVGHQADLIAGTAIRWRTSGYLPTRVRSSWF